MYNLYIIHGWLVWICRRYLLSSLMTTSIAVWYPSIARSSVEPPASAEGFNRWARLLPTRVSKVFCLRWMQYFPSYRKSTAFCSLPGQPWGKSGFVSLHKIYICVCQLDSHRLLYHFCLVDRRNVNVHIHLFRKWSRVQHNIGWHLAANKN